MPPSSVRISNPTLFPIISHHSHGLHSHRYLYGAAESWCSPISNNHYGFLEWSYIRTTCMDMDQCILDEIVIDIEQGQAEATWTHDVRSTDVCQQSKRSVSVDRFVLVH